ncbi:tRNA synthetase RNA-binding protein [Corynebacterium xerosis]|uniref:RNA-binding S4 domain-containing protein n=1 Tax=Corynebacterium xerosis TaxID=1725 RepID=UPI0006281818|nr:RNA-binding S4 domain-containing protein [Corynebacterium xerosis]KKO82246.1 tRNA synthetase RNA-binding protein [Corynebacterium xerosis]SQB96668.1 ribosome-associated heat shock protein [Clostridium paraputrificum]
MNHVDDSKPVRVDAWLWAVRLLKTRSQAADACRGGHVKINGTAVKPAQQVVPGDEIRVWANHRETIVEVTRTIAKRVGAPVAKTCYVDKTPAPPLREMYAALPVRDRGAGRPTKRERRQIDKLRGRD